MSSTYQRAEDHLPMPLVRRCRAILRGRAMVAFRASGNLTDTERLLGLDLVAEVRVALGGWHGNLYFAGSRRPGRRSHPRRQDARRLSRLGHAAQAIADAIGVTRATVSRWGIVSSIGRPTDDVRADPDAERRGMIVIRRVYRGLSDDAIAQECGGQETLRRRAVRAGRAVAALEVAR